MRKIINILGDFSNANYKMYLYDQKRIIEEQNKGILDEWKVYLSIIFTIAF